MNDDYKDALEIVVAELKSMPEVTCILFFGSVQQGDSTPSSDIDLFAIVEGNESWNYRRIVKGIEVEVYFLPEQLCRTSLENRNSIFVKAFSTGTALLDWNGKICELSALAKQLYDAGPVPPDSLKQNNWRIRLSDLIRDLEGSPPDSPESRMLASSLVSLSLEAYCYFQGLWSEKQSRLIKHISIHNPDLGQEVIRFYTTPAPHPNQAISIADYVLEPVGGRLLEYDGPRVSI
ncbi:nucleotidyltransferase domain-containing protein [Paenibacillus alkalitolerans]|uniref:nucleotidyltransferase domain-containing protein n=1 Tax=Paenibacillus alkalitolerans TaxID=2799335 RepID=UPI0018F513DD|nr:nucleotidyltransferase domain-containing protein [Paenibacillus alkalitolerans]